MEALRICYQMNNYQHVKRKIYLTHLKKTEHGPHIFIVTIVTRKVFHISLRDRARYFRGTLEIK